MSSQPKDGAKEEELRPLRSLLGSPNASQLAPDERLLAEAFHLVSEDSHPDSETASFDKLEGAAQRLARRRRWRYHLWEAWRDMGNVRLLATSAAVLVVISVAVLSLRGNSSSDDRGGLSGLYQRITQPSSFREQLTLRSEKESRSPLRCGAELFVIGQVDVEQKERFRPNIKLARGQVRVHVPPLPSGGKLVVETPDAEVIVHGTRFAVTREEGSSETSVRVEEGLVEVLPKGGNRAAVFLRAGESLTVPSLAQYQKTLGAKVGQLIEEGRCDAEADALLRSYLDSGMLSFPSENTVAESAARYHLGSCAADRGEVENAVSLFESVAKGDGIRADNALARIAQLRAEHDRKSGQLGWQRYLVRFPNGLHRESAHRYLKESEERPQTESPPR